MIGKENVVVVIYRKIADANASAHSLAVGIDVFERHLTAFMRIEVGGYRHLG